MKKRILNFIYKITDTLCHDKYYLKQVSYGELDDEHQYLLIKKEHTCAGIFEDYINFLLVIDFALSRGMIPVIDRLNTPAFFQQEEKEWFKKNGWEDYFEQPCKDISVEWIQSNAKNVVVCNHHITFEVLEIQSNCASGFMKMLLGNGYYAQHLKYIAQRYIRFNDYTRKKLENVVKEVLGSRKNIMGISIREETILRNEPTGKVSENGIYKMIMQYMNEWKCEYLFVSTEFQERIDSIVEHIGKNRVLYVDRKRPYNKDDPYEKEILERAADFEDFENCKAIMELQAKVFGPKSERWLSYIAEMYCLSKCSSALLQVSSGNIAAILMRESEYDNVVIINELV